MFKRRSAYTFIELSVAVAVIALLAVVVTLSLDLVRKQSRDSRRKADVQTLTNAIEQFTVYKGTSFIKYRGQNCTPPPNTQNEVETGLLGQATGSGCVGANGLSFGKMNVAGNAGTDGYGPYEGRTYREHSIMDALVEDGFLTSRPIDPLAKPTVITDPAQRDYVLIRGCKSGWQNVGVTGSYIGVWTSLERGLEPVDAENARKFPGGRNAGPISKPNYVFDFGATQQEYNQNAFYGRGFAVGSGATPVVSFATCADESNRI